MTRGLEGADAELLSTDFLIRSFVSSDSLRFFLFEVSDGDCELDGVFLDEDLPGTLNVASTVDVEAISRNKGSVLNTEAQLSPNDVTHVSDNETFSSRLPPSSEDE